MKIDFTADEVQFIEREMDRLASACMDVQNKMIMDGQFRAGSNKLLSDEENRIIKENFWNIMHENIQAYNMLKSIRDKLQEVREKCLLAAK